MRAAPITIVVHRPRTPQTQQELAARVAAVHAQAVTGYIRRLDCPSNQKSALADKVLAQMK